MTFAEPITLTDYANAREHVVMFDASSGHPLGEHTALGHPELSAYAEESDFLDLTGTIDGEGTWNWDGEGGPTDCQGNTITKLKSYIDAERWKEIVKEYHDAGEEYDGFS